MRPSGYLIPSILAIWAAASVTCAAQMEVQPLSPSWAGAQMFEGVFPHNQRHAATVPNRRPLGRASTTYRRDPAVTRSVVAKVSAYAERTSGPQAAQQMRDVLARTGVEPAWSSLTASHGYRPGDAADSLAAYWALNWSMANNRPADDRQMAGTRAQVRALMPGNPAFSRLGEAQRQAMSETFMLNYIIQHDAYGDALRRNDRAMLQRLSDTAEQRFRTEMGMDLRSLDLTEQGFRQKG